MATLTLTYSDGTRCSKCGKICNDGAQVRDLVKLYLLSLLALALVSGAVVLIVW